MIRKIVLENYMAHIRTVIEPAQGLTVLIGPNNCGKSAIIHALEMICYNSDAADYAIRHGAKKAVVTIETLDEDGTAHTMVWWRKENTAGYVIDGREISGLGRGNVPDDLHQHLRMPMVQSGDKEFLLHFGLQKAPIFLLDDPPSRAAQFFASATDADKLVQMQRVHQLKVTYAKRDKEKLDGELEQLDRQLGALAALPELSQRLGTLEDDHRTLTDLGTSIGVLRGRVQALNEADKSAAITATQIEALAPLQKPPILKDTQKIREWIDATERHLNETARSRASGGALRHLRNPPELAKTDVLRQICNDIDGAARRAAIDQGRAGALVGLSPPPQSYDVAAMKGVIEGICKSEERKAKCYDRNAILAALSGPPLLDDTRDLKKGIDEMGEAVNVRDRLKAQARKLSRLAPPPEPANTGPLRDSIQLIVTAAGAQSKCFKDLKKINDQAEQFRGEIKKWVEENPRCNACGQAITAELITSGGHRHE